MIKKIVAVSCLASTLGANAMYNTIVTPEEFLRAIGFDYRNYDGANYECEDDTFIIRFEVPGYEKDELKLELLQDGKVLYLEKKRISTNEKKVQKSLECKRPSSQKYQLPTAVDPDSVKANLKNGILEVRCQKVARSAQQITIE